MSIKTQIRHIYSYRIKAGEYGKNLKLNAIHTRDKTIKIYNGGCHLIEFYNGQCGYYKLYNSEGRLVDMIEKKMMNMGISHIRNTCIFIPIALGYIQFPLRHKL